MKEQFINRINTFVNFTFASQIGSDVTAAIVALPFGVKLNAIKNTESVKAFESGLGMSIEEAMA